MAIAGTARRAAQGRAIVARLRRANALARSGGSRAVARRLLTQALDRIGPSLETDVDISHVVAPIMRAVPAHRPSADRMRIGWVLTPPSPGSGGHTTILRLVQALEERGHECTLYLSWPGGAGDLNVHRRVLSRHFPPVMAKVADADAGFAPCDVLMATGWPSAYAVRTAEVVAHRTYLVQDYEPWFYPSGSQAALATATYRFGFHGITAGRWLAQELNAEFGMGCTPFEFGADHRYLLADPPERRNGVVFYARPETPRRAFELGVMALTEVAKRHPELSIHLFGAKIGRPLPFRYSDHGVLSAEELNGLYNRCQAGLVLSMSNLSLVPLELLGSGCIPVVNDAPHNRGVVENQWICWAQPEPLALADAICSAVEASSNEVARKAGASVVGLGWDSAGSTVEAALLRIVRGGGEGDDRNRNARRPDATALATGA